MTQQSRNTAPAIAPLRTLWGLGDEGMRRTAAAVSRLSPFPVDPGWYERYWYGDRSPSTWGMLVDTARRLCRDAPPIGSGWRAISRGELSHSLLDFAAHDIGR